MTAVVAGVLMRGDGCVLISQRRKEQSQGLKWEFPGGKIESVESPEEALERELREELGILTRTGKLLMAIRGRVEGKDLLLLYYESICLEGEPRAIDANKIEFAPISRLSEYDFGKIDREFVERHFLNRQLKRENV
ncbi:MAG: NUDIX domain-containing protein [Christensenellales bacterium]